MDNKFNVFDNDIQYDCCQVKLITGLTMQNIKQKYIVSLHVKRIDLRLMV